MALSLLHLPYEVLHGILVNIDPQDLAGICCCRALNDFIKRDGRLDKELYLKNFDEPIRDRDHTELSWSTELRRLVHFQKILESKDASLKAAKLQTVTQCVGDLLMNTAAGPSSSRNIPFLAKLFEPQENIDIFLCGSFLFDWAKAEAWGDLATARLRRDIESMLSNLESDRSNAELPDLEGNASVFGTSNEPDEAHLARKSAEDSEGIATPSRCRFNVPVDGRSCFLSHRRSLDRQLTAKLHCLYGVSVDSIRKDSVTSTLYSLRSDTAPIHPYARSLVYDLRQHTDNTLWGPFLDDGSCNVDWEKMEAIMILLDHNIKLSTAEHREFHGLMEAQGKPFIGASPYSFLSPPASIPIQPSLPMEAQDPYNVTGTWMRVVCFLDYAELSEFNFADEPPEEGQPRQPIDTQEAIRLITMKIHVTKIEPPGEEDGQRLPIVHFHGTSSSLRTHWDPNANSKIKGTVKLTQQGEVRWTTFSVYHGEERWRSEGIQVGGVQSARGVLGFWFDKDHDEHGPAGPTAFWKSQDGLEEKRPTASDRPQWSQFTYSLY